MPLLLHKQFFIAALITLLLASATFSQDATRPAQQPKSALGLIGSFVFVIESVEKGKVADHIGLRADDLILSVANRGFSSLDQFRALVQDNETPPVEILRRELVTPRLRTVQLPAVQRFAELGIDGNLGFRIQTVEPESPASAAGFLPGDIILAVNAKPFTSGTEFRQLGLSDPGTQFILKVQRTDQTGTHRYQLTIKTGNPN